MLIETASNLNTFIQEAKKHGAFELDGKIYLNNQEVSVSKKYEKIVRQYIKPKSVAKKLTVAPGEKLYNMCYTEESAKEVLAQLDLYDYVAYDTETTGLNVRKDKVIGYAVGVDKGIGFYLPILSWEQDKLIPVGVAAATHLEILNKLKTKKLIMHNASFDCRVTKSNFGVDLKESIYADTVMLQHTLDEESDFGLKTLAIKYSVELGLDSQDAANQEQLELEQSVVEAGGKWLKSDKEIYKGNVDIIGKYCCADVDITLRLFHYLETQLTDDLRDFFYNREVMPLYKLVTITMEEKGVHVDLNLLNTMNESISKDLFRLEKEVQAEIAPYSKKFIKDYLNEEYPVSNKGTFAQGVVEFFGISVPKLASGKYSITVKNVNAIEDERVRSFLLGDLTQLTAKETENIQNFIHNKQNQGKELVNITSKHHLAKIIFDGMGEEAISETEKGTPQVNEILLLSLKDKYSWIAKLIDYNKLSKIKSAYVDRFLENHENGIFYPQFKQHATTSGRYGSDLQQLTRPKDEESGLSPLVLDYTNKIREIFIAPEGYKFIDDDYESLEPRVFADDGGDKSLLEIFTKNLDIYSVVAIMALGLKDVSADKKADNFLKKKYPEIRQQAKPYALGIRFGMKSFKLAKTLNIEEEEAQAIIDNYFKAFPNLKTKMDQYLSSAKTTGTVTSKFGRVRHLPKAKKIYDFFGDDILDYKKLFAISKNKRVPMEELKRIRKEYNNLLNNALNFPIQSAATSVINQAMIAASKEFMQKNLDAWISLAVHDQVVVTTNSKCVSEVCEIVQRCMETTNLLSVPLVAVPQIATNLRDGH